MAAGDISRAGMRLLDLVKDFPPVRELRNDAVRLVGRINLLKRDVRRRG